MITASAIPTPEEIKNWRKQFRKVMRETYGANPVNMTVGDALLAALVLRDLNVPQYAWPAMFMRETRTQRNFSLASLPEPSQQQNTR